MRHLRPLLTVSLLLVSSTLVLGQDKPTKNPPGYPGPTDAGYMLPNGWRLSPAGKQVILTDLPLNIRTTPDGKYALVATNGYNAHELTAIELATLNKSSVESARQSWFGLAADETTSRLWWSGGGDAVVRSFAFTDGKLEPRDTFPIEDKSKDAPADNSKTGFRTGVYFDAKSNALISLTAIPKGGNKSFAWGDATTDERAGGAITRIDLSKQGKDISTRCGQRPYDVVRGKNGLLYVSDWADRCILTIDPETLRTVGRIPVGEHPNQIVLHPKDDRLFVACATSNAVYVIDTSRGTVQEVIHTALFPSSPEGSTPDALAIDSDGEMLYVANADNNCVAVIDVEVPRKSLVKGFIPTGWYPTSLAVTPDDKKLLTGVGKGNVTQPNRVSDERIKEARSATPGEGGYIKVPFPHVGTTLSGALSIVDVPGEKELAKYTDQVYKNCPYSDKLLTAAPYERKTAIPTKVGDASPIKHIIYIIKENRTYDQVFSDIPRGNRDPSLLMFGEEITPNHHKLANEFVLLDNLYCNGHVSADGHPWSTMAYNTDYIARNWALTYSKRSGIDDDDEGDLTRAPSGYIWDACKRNGLSYRNYGEYGGRVSQPDGTFKMDGRVPSLIGHVCPNYDLRVEGKPRMRDTENVDVFLKEFRDFVEKGTLPRMMVMSLGEDHTQGTSPGAPTPQACVASNDLALGRLVEGVSKSKVWKETAIFVIEDDAQNGADHVDAHRTIGLVISPYVRRHHLDSTQYGTVSMLRTMELILGLPPLSQFDAAATPMFESFSDKPDLTPYEHLPARINLEAKNTPLAYGAERSSKMDFSEYDKIDDFELNEILWRAVKGVNAPLPPAVRRAIAYRDIELPAAKVADDK
jgi:DNA-binding beta-propeller fold protein YncE